MSLGLLIVEKLLVGDTCLLEKMLGETLFSPGLSWRLLGLMTPFREGELDELSLRLKLSLGV